MARDSFIASFFRKKQISCVERPRSSRRSASNCGSNAPENSGAAPNEITSLYTDFKVIGEGTYGVVYKARAICNGQPVALKKIRLTTGDSTERLASTGVSTTAVREILLLRELEHPSVVELREVFFTTSPSIQLWLTFEFCLIDLRQYIKAVSRGRKAMLIPGGLPEAQVCRFVTQILRGLEFSHDLNILHRDLKPQNILMALPDAAVAAFEKYMQANVSVCRSAVREDETELEGLRRCIASIPAYGESALKIYDCWETCVAKIADLGLARSCKLHQEQLTQEVVTLWYRSPELLLGISEYNGAVDIWSMGCIVAEMLSGKPLFAGDSEVDTLFKIFQVLGTPSDTSVFGAACDLPRFQKAFPRWEVDDPVRSLTNSIYDHTSTPSELAIEFVERCLRYDPERRMSATEALAHPWLQASAHLNLLST